MRAVHLIALTATGLALTACGTTGAALTTPRYASRPDMARPQRAAPTVDGVGKVGRPYQINGITYTPRYDPDYDETGLASWYGEAFDGKPTALGEPFDMWAMSAAHKTLPLPSLVEVTNLDNGKKTILRINDRGPFVDGRIIDLSKGAAEELGMLRAGVAKVRVRYVGPVSRDVPEPTMYARREEPRSAQFYEVQAGLFSQRANAERAAQQIASAGDADIRPVEREGAVLWRVVVGGLNTPDQAERARQRVIDSGFPDARVAGPF